MHLAAVRVRHCSAAQVTEAASPQRTHPATSPPSLSPSVVGHYWVYYKSAAHTDMLCAMDLWRAGPPQLTPAAEAAAAGGEEGASDPGIEGEFSINWDRYRLFRAGNRADAEVWVAAIRAVQAQQPAGGGEGPGEQLGGGASGGGLQRVGGAPAYTAPGGGGPEEGDEAGEEAAEEWGVRGGTREGRGGARRGQGGGRVCCVIM